MKIARQILIDLVAQFGADICKDAKRCEGLLRDKCLNQHKREVNVLIVALKENVVSDLLVGNRGIPQQAWLGRLSKRLHDDSGIEESLAKWSVESWAVSLKIVIESVASNGFHTATSATPDLDIGDPFAKAKSQASEELLRQAIRRILSDDVVTEQEKTQAKALQQELGISAVTASRLFWEEKARLSSTAPTLSWATVLLSLPDPAVVTDAAARARMTATKLPWKIRDNATGITMLLVPPGGFMMGSPSNENGRGDYESERRVTISKAFYLSQTAVTQEFWLKVMGANRSHFQGPQNPVEQISWDDCQKFCRATGMRLPSETEWEYACRAGTTTPFSFGATITPQQVNYAGNYPYGGGRKGLYRAKTVICGSLPSNQWGFHEMHGNVLEWCQDGYSQTASTTEVALEIEIGARVMRGGGWYRGAYFCRASSRDFGPPSRKGKTIGCRFARGAV